MQKVKEIMTKNVYTVTNNTNIIDAIILLIEKGVAGLPVIDDDNNLIGIITEKDMLEFLQKGSVSPELRISDFAKENVISVNLNDELKVVNEYFQKKFMRMLPVVDEGKLVGVVARRDVLKFILNDAFEINM